MLPLWSAALTTSSMTFMGRRFSFSQLALISSMTFSSFTYSTCPSTSILPSALKLRSSTSLMETLLLMFTWPPLFSRFLSACNLCKFIFTIVMVVHLLFYGVIGRAGVYKVSESGGEKRRSGLFFFFHRHHFIRQLRQRIRFCPEILLRRKFGDVRPNNVFLSEDEL